jgi:ssDNA-binding Zn-finger/Zn-ribbon topoisomerase 1
MTDARYVRVIPMTNKADVATSSATSQAGRDKICPKCGVDTVTWLYDGQPRCLHCAANPDCHGKCGRKRRKVINHE